MEIEHSLTIAIPTYNRPDHLIETLLQLQGQDGIDKSRILVVDNASDEPVSELLSNDVLQRFGDVEVRRNAANLGLSGNILRCMELADSEWLWILADDDNLEPGAVAAILDVIGSGQDLDFVMFAQAEGQVGGVKVADVGSFARTLDDWKRITFISAGLYRVNSIRPLLNIGINYAYSVVPFIAMILHGVQDCNWKIAFEDKVLVRAAHKAQSTWSWIWSINTYVVSELVNDRAVANRLIGLAGHWCLGPIGLIHDYMVRKAEGKPGLSRLGLEHKLFLIGWGSWRQRLLLRISLPLLHLPPRIALSLIEILRMAMGRSSRSQRSGEDVFGQV